MKLTKKSKILGTALLALGLSAQPIKAEPVNVSVDNTLANKYMFWGLKFRQDPVLQSMVNINKGNLTATGFVNTDLKTKNVNEGDVFVDYSFPINDKVYFSIGGGLYNFQTGKTWEKDQEAYAGISFAGPLNMGLVYHRLFGLGKGDYIEASLGKSFEAQKIGLTTSTKVGYHHNQYTEVRGISHVDTGIDADIPLTKRISVQPSLRYTYGLDDKISNEVYGGTNIHCSF